MKTYLVQRATIEDRDYKQGIDKIIHLDYMGASEYEWGAVPDSLNAIRNNIADYTYMDIPMDGKIITVFCNVNVRDEVPEMLNKLASDEMHCKCYHDFNNLLRPSNRHKDWLKKHPLRTNFWWDIENHLMWWEKNNEFEKKFKKEIENKPIIS
jgi:hypothetical protein